MQTLLTITNKEYFDAKLIELQRKFTKLHVTPPNVISTTVRKEKEIIDGLHVVSTYYDITLEYVPFQIEGFSFVCKIDLKDSIFYTAPNETLPESELHFDNHCVECNKSIERNEIFVLRNDETKEYIRLGRNCLARYIGIEPDNILQMAGSYDALLALTNDENLTKRIKPNYHLSFVLGIGLFVADKVGFVSIETSKQTGKVSTAAYVRDLLEAIPLGITGYKSISEKLTADFIEGNKAVEYNPKALECIEWMKEQRIKLTPYHQNIAQLADNGTVNDREIAFAVSAISGYIKSKENTVSNSKFVGTVGDKFTAKTPLLVECIALSVPQASNYGYNQPSLQFYTLLDCNGNVYSTFTQSGKLEVGQKVKLTGTIKEHRQFNGTNQTVLKNCRFEIV